MAYVTITLTAESSENSGPFDIIGTPGNTVLFSAQSYNDLASGQVYDIDMNTYTGITLTSSGVCNNSVQRERENENSGVISSNRQW